MSSEFQPLVSVVMPVYNAETYLAMAIESILNQTFSAFEFIIINDGSVDSGIDIIRSYKDPRIILIDQENTGLAKALNNGIAIARGKYIARMDNDDISLPKRLEVQYNYLEKNPNCVVVGSNATLMDKDGQILYSSNQLLQWDEIKKQLPSTPFFHSSTMFRKNIFDQCGGYFDKYPNNPEDLILWNQMSRFGELHNVPDILLKYRVVPTAGSNRTPRTTLLLNKLISNVIQKDRWDDKDYLELEKLTKSRSHRWKMSNYYLNIGKIFLERNFNRKKALVNLFFSVFYFPFNMIGWFNLFLLLFPEFLIHKWKKSRGL